MKEALIILLVVFALAGLTAVRYRRQIAAMVRVWRMLKAARTASQHQRNGDELGTPKNEMALVNCAKCGAWVTPDQAVKLNANTYICSRSCMRTKAPSA